MAIVYRSYPVWSYVTGRVPGADHLPTGEVYRGFIYYNHVNTVGGFRRLIITLSNGESLKIHQGETEASKAGKVKVKYLGEISGGQHCLEVVPLVTTTPPVFVGVQSVEFQGYFETSPNEYNPLRHAAWSIWKGGSDTEPHGTVAAGQKKVLLDHTSEDAWHNTAFDRDGETITFRESFNGDRVIIFSFKADIVPTSTAGGSDPFNQAMFQLRRGDDIVYASSPVAYISTAETVKARQMDITAFIRGSDDPLVQYGMIPEVINLGQGDIKFSNAYLSVCTIDSPEYNHLKF